MRAAAEKLNLKILIIEKSIEDLHLIEELLNVVPHCSYELTKTTSGHDGIAYAKKHIFDCILVSNSLTDINAKDFFTELKSVSLINSKTAILLSNTSAEEDALKIIDHGFQDYLVKDTSLTSWVLSRIISKTIDNFKLQALVDQLSEALKAREDFLSIAAHELKTPLTVAKMKFQMGLRHIENNPKESLNLATLIDCYKDGDRQISRLNRVVDNLLDLTRLESNKLNLNLNKMDLSELINEVVDRFIPQLRFSNCVPEIIAPEKLVGVWDYDRLDQVLSNLMTNILRYACGSPFSLEVSQVNEKVSLIITDSGVGIPLEDQERIFSRYERSESSRNHQGIGLGLFITRGIIESHKGSIRVDPNYKNGCRMIIDLPLDSTN